VGRPIGLLARSSVRQRKIGEKATRGKREFAAERTSVRKRRERKEKWGNQRKMSQEVRTGGELLHYSTR